MKRKVENNEVHQSDIKRNHLNAPQSTVEDLCNVIYLISKELCCTKRLKLIEGFQGF